MTSRAGQQNARQRKKHTKKSASMFQNGFFIPISYFLFTLPHSPFQILFLSVIFKGDYVFDGFFGGDDGLGVVEVDQDVFVVSHADFFHVRELAEAFSAFHAFDHVVAVAFVKRVYEIDGGLIDGENIRRGQNPDIRRGDGSGGKAFAVAGNGHVAQRIHVRDVRREMIDGGFGRFRHAFHEFFFRDAPLAVGVSFMNPFFADFAVRAADADIFIRAAEASHRVAFEMREDDEGIVIQKPFADGHFFKVFAAGNGEERCAFRVDNFDGSDFRPAVHANGFQMFFGAVAIAGVVRIRLDNRGAGNVFFNEMFHPGARQNIRPVFLAGVKLDGDAAGDVSVHFFISFFEPFSGEIAGEIYDGGFGFYMRHIHFVFSFL